MLYSGKFDVKSIIFYLLKVNIFDDITKLWNIIISQGKKLIFRDQIFSTFDKQRRRFEQKVDILGKYDI